MGQLVVAGAMLMCPMGKTPVPLVVVPQGPPVVATAPAATIMDFVPMENIATFGACSSPANPAVVAALGAPVPCVPAIAAPWAPGAPTVTINGQPALTAESKCICTLSGGAPISITFPGQTIVNISG
jgi:hypothetical protein